MGPTVVNFRTITAAVKRANDTPSLFEQDTGPHLEAVDALEHDCEYEEITKSDYVYIHACKFVIKFKHVWVQICRSSVTCRDAQITEFTGSKQCVAAQSHPHTAQHAQSHPHTSASLARCCRPPGLCCS